MVDAGATEALDVRRDLRLDTAKDWVYQMDEETMVGEEKSQNPANSGGPNE